MVFVEDDDEDLEEDPMIAAYRECKSIFGFEDDDYDITNLPVYRYTASGEKIETGFFYDDEMFWSGDDPIDFLREVKKKLKWYEYVEVFILNWKEEVICSTW